MLGQLTVIQKTGKSDLCGRKVFIPLTLMIGKFDFRTSKTFIRPEIFTQVKNTSLSQIRPEVRGHTLKQNTQYFHSNRLCGKSTNMSKRKIPTNFKLVALSSGWQESDRWEGVSPTVQVTPEQHGFELRRSTHTVFSIVMLQDYIHRWLDPWMQNHIPGGTVCLEDSL